MKKIKLTQQQVDAINEALDILDGNADYLLERHSKITETNNWTTYPALNELSFQDLYDALKYGYTVEEGKVKLTREQIKALEYLEYEVELSIQDILKIHSSKKDAWEEKASCLNVLSLETLDDALHKGFEVEEKLTMDEVIALVRKDNLKQKNKSTEKELKLELDYQLSSLHDAMQDGNIEEIDKIKQRLAEIHSELGLGV